MSPAYEPNEHMLSGEGQQQQAEYIRAMARGEAKVETLTENFRELKRTIEELIDRVDTDVDTLRQKTEGLGVISAAIEDFKRRATVIETKVDVYAIDMATLKAGFTAASVGMEKRMATIEATVESLKQRVWMAAGAFSIIAFIAARVIK